MRFVHTADWHLGRQFHGRSLVEDQTHVLASLVDLIRTERPDALVIAGDVYDRAVPPADAVALLDATLSEIVLGLETPVLMIAGNHDSAERLGFAAGILATNGLHVRGTYTDSITPVTLVDESGPVDFCLLPYVQGEPLTARTRSGNSNIDSFDAAMAAACKAALAACRSPRQVAVSHAFVAGGDESDSERPLSVGGSDQVSPRHYADFDYVALGHLHRPQKIGDKAAYSGSLLKYSFSESNHNKSVSLVALDDDGAASRTEVPLSIRRDVRIIEGTLDALLGESSAISTQSSDDYILARLTDHGALYDPLARLRERYPNILQIERPALFVADDTTRERARETLQRTDVDLFSAFVRDVTGTEITEAELTTFSTVVDTLHTDTATASDASDVYDAREASE